MATGKLTLERLLRESGMTKTRFAQFSGVHRASIANYLNGSGHPTLRTVQKLACAFGLSVARMSEVLSEPRPSRGTTKKHRRAAVL